MVASRITHRGIDRELHIHAKVGSFPISHRRMKKRMVKEMIGIMNAWSLDERFIRLMRYNESRHWLDFQSLKERNFRDMLAWLLNPREGHGLGDFFLMRMLQAVYRSEEVRDSPLHRLWEIFPSPFSLIGESLRLASVAVEVSCNVSQESKRRNDIVVVEPYKKILLIIERKDGSVASSRQLQAYRKWAEEAYEGYRHIFILSDSQDNEHEALREAHGWVQVGDDWLAECLDEVVDKGMLPPYINQQLKDFLKIVSDKEIEDEYFDGLDEDLLAFVKDRQEEIRLFRSLRVPGGRYRFVEIDSKLAITSLLPRCGDPSLVAAIEFSARNSGLLRAICESSELELLQREIEEKYPHAGGLEFSIWRRKLRGDDILDITIERFKDLNSWPLYLRLIKPAMVRSTVGESPRDSERMFIRFEFSNDMDDSTTLAGVLALLKEFNCRRGSTSYSTLAKKINVELSYKNVRPFLDKLVAAERILGQYDEA